MRGPEHRVLLVDDHPLFRRGVRAIIDGIDSMRVVAEADGAAAALTLARVYRPDIAVVDLGLPDTSGLELVPLLSALPRALDIVVLTLYGDQALVDRALELGVKGFVVKSDGADVLRECLEGVLRGELFVSPGINGANGAAGPGPVRAEADDERLATLTRRERAILRAVADGDTSATIAERLGLSARTVQNHRARAARKLGLRGHNQLFLTAMELRDRL